MTVFALKRRYLQGRFDRHLGVEGRIGILQDGRYVTNYDYGGCIWEIEHLAGVYM